jgi:nitrogen regulatory protein P-II 1
VKKIEAIIRPERLDAVKEALEAKDHHSMTVYDVEGRGRQKGIQLEWRVGTYNVEFLPKIKIEIICAGADCQEVIDTICDAAQTGEVGDGKIFVSEILDVIRIRTKESGQAAI